MDTFKKPQCVPFRKVKCSEQGKHQNARLDSSVTSVSPSTSLCSQQTRCFGYDYAKSLYKSVLDDSISSNDSKILQDSSGLHSSIKKFGQTVWVDLLNSIEEWQIKGFVENHKERKARPAMSNGNLNQKMVTFDRWWCILTDKGLCIKGYVENKNDKTVKTAPFKLDDAGPIIKRMDFHTVASQESLIKLKNFCGEVCEPRLPHYIKSRFACGFPEDWKLLKKKWLAFLKEDEPQDFQWEENDNAASSDSCSVLQNPSGQSSQGSNCEEFTNKSQESSFSISPLVAKNKLTERVLRVKRHDTKNIGNWPHLEEERTHHVAKRNEPQCRNSDTIIKENFLSTKRSFEVISDDSENSDSEGTGFLNMRTNCQDVKSKDKLYGNTKQHSKNKDEQYANMKQHSKCKDEQSGNQKKQSKSKDKQYENKKQQSKSNGKQDGNTKQQSKSKDEQYEKKKKPSKSKDKQGGNKKKESGVRRTNTTQALVGVEILLEKWLPVLIEDELCFRGVRSSSSSATSEDQSVGSGENSYTTASVKSRLKSDTVTLVDGNTCKLIGHLYDERNCLPTKIGKMFQSGVPQFWRKILAMWIVYSKNTEVEAAMRINLQQQGILKTSSRGRILLQPVKHWLGETTSSIINNLADHGVEKQVELLKSKCSHPLPAEKIVSSTSDKEHCGMLNMPDALPQKNIKNAVNSKRKKELVDRNVKKSKKEQQPPRPDSDKVVNSDPLGGNTCPDTQFENPTYFANSEGRVLRSRNKQIVVQKESSNAILHENKSVGIGKNAVSRRSHSHNKKHLGKLKESSTISVLHRDNEDTTSAGKSKPTINKANKKDELRPLKLSDMDINFTDFLGKPPRTLKQRKKLDKIVKTVSQNKKKNVDLFDDISEGHDSSRAAWNDFIVLKDVGSYSVGDETPRSKMLNGSYFKTPETSPSHSMFQISPCDSNELLKYVHQRKTKNDKTVKKTGTKKTKLQFIHTSSGNHDVDAAYAALLKGEPVPQHIISKEMRVDTDNTDSFSDSSYLYCEHKYLC